MATFVSAAVAVNGDSIAITFSAAGTSTTGFTAATNGSAPLNSLTLGTGSWAGSVLTLPITNRNATSTATESTITVSGPGAADYTAFTNSAVTNSSTVAVIATASGTLIDEGPIGINASWTYVASVWTAGATKTVRMVGFDMYKVGTPTFTLNAYMFNTSAGVPTTTIGTGSSNFVVSVLTGSSSRQLFPFMAASISNGTVYGVGVIATGSPNDGSNWVRGMGYSTGTQQIYHGTSSPDTLSSEFASSTYTIYGN